ncbi:MAG TPA: protein kinase, partial [Polyangiales bacterium]|nr:protein kinase [Polyangiales bacterium]
MYSAVHEDLRRDVAVKVLDKSWASDRTAIERFLQEARTASGLSHGNIVDVLDLGRLPDGRPYLVMPLIVGFDLATVLAEEGPQHPKRVASLLGGVASALDLIHAKGLVHHDIKPENLMQVRREDGSETVVVLDFGIAGARFPLDGRGIELFDRGTPEFMPPEAASGIVPDRRGDIYALATVAFELMTGRLPFESNDDAELATLKATRPPSSMTYASGLSFPLALEAVVARGLATRPAERYATAGEFVRRLAHVAAQIADDFLTQQRGKGSTGPMLEPPSTRPQRRAVTSRSRTLMTAGGLARVSGAAKTEVPASAETALPAAGSAAETAVPAAGSAAETAVPASSSASAEPAIPAANAVETKLSSGLSATPADLVAPAQPQAPAAAASSAPASAAKNSSAQTQPQMHAVSVPPAAPADRPQAFGEASAEASGARALPREGDAQATEAGTPAAVEQTSAASEAPSRRSKTATLSPAAGMLAPVRPSNRASATPTLTSTVMAAADALHARRPSPLPSPAVEMSSSSMGGADRVDPLAPTLINMPAQGATATATVSSAADAALATAESGPATMLEWGPTEASGTFLREDAEDEAPAAASAESSPTSERSPSLTQP